MTEQTFGEFFRELEAAKAREEESRREKKEAGTIYLDGRHPNPTEELRRNILNGTMTGGWRDASLIPKLEAEARRKAKLDGETIVDAGEPEFDREEEL